MGTSVGVRIDLNADVGEAYGARIEGDDEPIFAYVTSANVACGFHAGDPEIMAATVKAAASHGVAVGAHPSYPDRERFGRVSMSMSPEALRDCIVYQLGALDAVARLMEATLTHVKPHGALYNDAAKDAGLAQTVAQAVAAYDRRLILVGLAGSALLQLAGAAGLRSAAEAFCDRRYQDDGSLCPRSASGAVIQSADEAVRQALCIVLERSVITARGKRIGIDAQTLCIHADTPNALALASAVADALTKAGVRLTTLGQLF
ncbi:MAG: LamB/YcsF family protein [Candidatus Eremiobacter antarcticus]|nr:LamB/YcsF family protein [Candidatus Eremiobacteraeota bacterium]MBC5807563.1 LamB/YcsF family protein [Candidatus Eremiobacteraeota bacterium]PZR61385.1 MAG: LamB/YcsF family protein [Candidatus Eremiobacter sp. RRmetagenome_bin22]